MEAGPSVNVSAPGPPLPRTENDPVPPSPDGIPVESSESSPSPRLISIPALTGGPADSPWTAQTAAERGSEQVAVEPAGPPPLQPAPATIGEVASVTA